MGKVNDVLHHYLEDAERFADLYNGVFFEGKPVIDSNTLTEASESYYDAKTGDCSALTKKGTQIVPRSRDLKKIMKSGGALRILAVENQNQVDYSMRLYCVTENSDFSMFKTELKELFTVMQHRKNKKQLQKILEENEAYKHLSGETADAIAAVVDLPLAWRNKEMYRNNQEEKEGYNMCQALREWAEDERNAGRTEGIKEGIKENTIRLIEKVCKKISKGKSVPVIADELEEDEALITQICTSIEKFASEYDYEKIYKDLYSEEAVVELE